MASPVCCHHKSGLSEGGVDFSLVASVGTRLGTLVASPVWMG